MRLFVVMWNIHIFIVNIYVEYMYKCHMSIVADIYLSLMLVICISPDYWWSGTADILQM